MNDTDQSSDFSQRRTLYEIVNDFTDSMGESDSNYKRFINYKPIPKLLPYFASKKSTKAIIGANRSTKTWATIFEDIMIFTGIIPPALKDIYPHKIPTDRKRIVRIITMSYSKHWPETIKPILIGPNEGMLPKLWANWDEETHIFTGPDGSMLSIMSIDPREKIDPNILRGAGVDHTHIDEITSKEVYEESLTRAAALHDGPADVTLSFCPQEGFDWTYTELFLPTHDSNTEEPLPEEKQHKDIFCVYGLSMDDNPSITQEKKDAVKNRLKPSQLAYRYYGKYSLRGDNAYFNSDILDKWYRAGWVHGEPVAFIVKEKRVDVNEGIFVGELEHVELYDETRQNIWFIWALPVNGHKYIMSQDNSDGNPKSDFNVADIFDATDENHIVQVAQFRKREIKPGDFTIQALCMANIYGDCLFAPEAGPSAAGGAAVDRAQNYGNIYQRITVGNIEEDTTIKLGWATSRLSKPAMLEDTYDTLLEMNERDGWCPFRSRVSLSEFMNFQEKVERDGNNKTKTTWGAKQGGHDDTVATACIAFRIIRHEIWLLTLCRLNPNIPDSQLDYVSKLETESQRLSNEREVHKEPSMKILRKQALGQK